MLQGRHSLPARYRDDRLHVVAVDPNRLWVYWDEGEAVKRVAARRLPQEWPGAPRQLRLHRAQGDVRTIDCHGEYGSCYVEDLTTASRYRVEYGVQMQGRFWPLFEREVSLPGGPRDPIAPQRREQASSFSTYTIYSQS